MTAYYRSESSSGGKWWYDSGEKPWWYNNGSHAVPDENSTANDIHFNNNTHTTMTLNGKWYLVNYLEFESGASTARTLNKDGDTGMNVYYGIKNLSTATHVIAAPVSFDNNAQTVTATNGSLTFSQPVYLNANVTFDAASSKTITISGVVGNTGGTLTKAGKGTLDMSGANTYTKATTVNAGTLKFSNATGLGTTAAGTTVASGAILQYTGTSAVSEGVTLNGGTLYGYATATWSGAVTLGANSTVQVYSGKTFTMSGNITGSFGITQTGAGTLYLSGAKGYTGTTTINGGTVKIDNATSLGTTAGGTTVASGKTLQLNASSAITVAEPLTLNGGTIQNSGGRTR